MHGRIAISSSTERRIRREARSETLRERALALRRAGWTFARIGIALGVSTTRVFQMVRKAERLIAERVAERDSSPDHEAGTPIPRCPFVSNDGPLAATATKLSNGHVYTCHRQLEASHRRDAFSRAVVDAVLRTHFRVHLRMVRSRHDADRASGREITKK